MLTDCRRSNALNLYTVHVYQNFAVVYYIDFYPKLFILCSLVYTAIFSMPYAFFLKTIITSSSTTGSGTFFCNYINCKRRSFIHCRWTETSERIETSIDTVHVVSYAFDAQYNQIQWSTSNIKTEWRKGDS